MKISYVEFSIPPQFIGSLFPTLIL